MSLNFSPRKTGFNSAIATVAFASLVGSMGCGGEGVQHSSGPAPINLGVLNEAWTPDLVQEMGNRKASGHIFLRQQNGGVTEIQVLYNNREGKFGESARKKDSDNSTMALLRNVEELDGWSKLGNQPGATLAFFIITPDSHLKSGADFMGTTYRGDPYLKKTLQSALNINGGSILAHSVKRDISPDVALSEMVLLGGEQGIVTMQGWIGDGQVYSSMGSRGKYKVYAVAPTQTIRDYPIDIVINHPSNTDWFLGVNVGGIVPLGTVEEIQITDMRRVTEISRKFTANLASNLKMQSRANPDGSRHATVRNAFVPHN